MRRFIPPIVLCTLLGACAPYESRFLRVPRTMWQAPDRAVVLDIPASDQSIIRGWLFRPQTHTDEIPNPIVIIAHGRSDSMADYRELAPDLADAMEATIVVFDYRGFGASSDLESPTRRTMIDDTKAVLAYLGQHDEFRADHTSIWGVSLGAYPACATFSDDPGIDALLLWGAPANIRDLINDGHEDLNPLAQLLANLLVPRYRAPEDELKQAGDRPVVIAHAEQDEIVRVRHAHALHASAPAAALLIDEAGSHGSISPEATDLMIEWYRSITQTPEQRETGVN